MEPIEFKHSNITLNPPPKNDSGIEIIAIRAWTDGSECVSCWRMSWRERFAALIFGKVWLSLLSGRTMPPAYVVACNEYLKESK